MHRNQFDKDGFFLNHLANGSGDPMVSRAGFGVLHDGSIDGIVRFLSEPAFSNINNVGAGSNQNVADIVSFTLAIGGADFTYLKTLLGAPTGSIPPAATDQSAHAGVGHSITIDAMPGGSSDGENIIYAMSRRANEDVLGMVVVGKLNGERRGWAHTSGTNSSAILKSDRSGETIGMTALLALAGSSGAEMTFLMVPTEEAVRRGYDRDLDSLFDRDEADNGTDPTDSDSDDDGVSDGDEVNVHMTDPREADSDGDGRTDGEEVNGNPTSDPADPDTDDDGFKDGAEVLAGTDPNDPDSKPELLPIGYWSFDDQGAGGTTADLSPGGNDGTLNGNPEIVPGACGEDGDFAFKFDGIDDFIGTGASLLTGLDDYTMSGWVKFDTPQLVNRIGWFGQNDAVEFGLINPAQLQHWTVVGGALNIAVADTAPWTHVLVTGDATGRTVYLDGVQAGSGPSSLRSGLAFPLNFGGGPPYFPSGNSLTRWIDKLAVWH